MLALAEQGLQAALDLFRVRFRSAWRWLEQVGVNSKKTLKLEVNGQIDVGRGAIGYFVASRRERRGRTRGTTERTAKRREEASELAGLLASVHPRPQPQETLSSTELQAEPLIHVNRVMRTRGCQDRPCWRHHSWTLPASLSAVCRQCGSAVIASGTEGQKAA